MQIIRWKLKIRLGNRAHRIQHASIMLKSLIPHFYPKMHLTFTILRNASSLSLHILLSFTSEKACCQVSCSSTACDWTTGRKRSHSNSNKLTDKWGVDCCIIFMATDDVTESVVYKRRGSACCVCTETKLQQISARKTPIITQPALFSKHNRIRALGQTKVELLHSLQFTAPCCSSINASQKMPDKQYAP